MQTLRRIEASIAAGRGDRALTEWRAGLRSTERDWRYWYAMASLGVRLRQGDTLACLRKAAELTGDATPAVALAQHLLMAGDVPGALRAARDARDRQPDGMVPLAQLATVLARCDAGEEALPLFERAAALAPDDPTILFNLATAQRTNGLLTEAEATVDAMLRLRPDDAEALYFRAGLRRQTEDRNHVDGIAAAIRRRGDRGDPADAPLHFALGKELEDLGRFPAALARFEAGCRLRRSAFRYDVADDVATIDALVARHDAAALTASAAAHPAAAHAAAAAPIFVVGLPRSGTTLVERILAAHPEVTAGGELDAFPRAAVAAVGAGGGSSKRDFVARSLAIPPDALAAAYLDRVGERRGTTPRFTDKLPINALYLGLIGRALPNATIVLLRRDAMANGFAMFSTLFADAYPFSYSFAELGAYMTAWDRLMTHWTRTLGGRILTLRYEDLVADPERQTRGLLDHCGLDWDPRCLDLHLSSGSVSSASATQVRQPIYRDAVSKWRHYGALLDPLRSALGPLAATD